MSNSTTSETAIETIQSDFEDDISNKSIWNCDPISIARNYTKINDNSGWVEWVITATENDRKYKFAICGRITKEESKQSYRIATIMMGDLFVGRGAFLGEYFASVFDLFDDLKVKWNCGRQEITSSFSNKLGSTETTFSLPVDGMMTIAHDMANVLTENGWIDA